MADKTVKALFLAIADWAKTQGILSTPVDQIWHGETLPMNGLGPFTVKMNRSGETIGSLPMFHASVSANDWPVAIVNPLGGIVNSYIGEDGLIAHFAAQTEGPTDARPHD